MYLLTGSTGFLGNRISKELFDKNIPFKSISRDPNSEFYFDFLSGAYGFSASLKVIESVIHVAGQAHIVPKTSLEKELFFRVNATGTEQFLKLLEEKEFIPQKFIFISSVAVYGRIEGDDIDETAPLNAQDPYGKSKIFAEEFVEQWCRQNGVKYYILRLPLIAGKNAPGNLGAMVKGIRTGRYARIGDAKARKSIVLAEDVAELVSNINGPSGFYNLTDGYHPSFSELENLVVKQLSLGPVKKIPFILARLFSLIGDLFGNKAPINSKRLTKITSELTFSDLKARKHLNWNPKTVLDNWEI